MPFREIILANLVWDKSVRELCVTRKNGKEVHVCPNYKKSLACPPYSPYLEPVLKKYNRFWLVWFHFDLKSFSERMQNRHPNWSDKMCHNPRYYNNTIRKGLRGEIEQLVNKLRWGLGFEKQFYTLWGGTCRVCKNSRDGGCAITKGIKKCKYPKRRTYSMESVGIDVTKTVRNVGIELEWPVRDNVYQIGLVCFK